MCLARCPPPAIADLISLRTLSATSFAGLRLFDLPLHSASMSLLVAGAPLLQHRCMLSSSRLCRLSRASLFTRLPQRCVAASSQASKDLPDVQRLAELSQIEVTPEEVTCRIPPQHALDTGVKAVWHFVTPSILASYRQRSGARRSPRLWTGKAAFEVSAVNFEVALQYASCLTTHFISIHVHTGLVS